MCELRTQAGDSTSKIAKAQHSGAVGMVFINEMALYQRRRGPFDRDVRHGVVEIFNAQVLEWSLKILDLGAMLTKSDDQQQFDHEA